jgi:hypothetical protein
LLSTLPRLLLLSLQHLSQLSGPLQPSPGVAVVVPRKKNGLAEAERGRPTGEKNNLIVARMRAPMNSEIDAMMNVGGLSVWRKQIAANVDTKERSLLHLQLLD